MVVSKRFPGFTRHGTDYAVSTHFSQWHISLLICIDASAYEIYVLMFIFLSLYSFQQQGFLCLESLDTGVYCSSPKIMGCQQKGPYCAGRTIIRVGPDTHLYMQAHSMRFLTH